MRSLSNTLLALLGIVFLGFVAFSAAEENVQTCLDEISHLCPVEIVGKDPIFNTRCYYDNRWKLTHSCQVTIEQFRQLILKHQITYPKHEGGYTEMERMHYSCHADIQRLCPDIKPPYNPHKVFQTSCFRRHVTSLSPRCLAAMNKHVSHHKGSKIVMETLPIVLFFGCFISVFLGGFLFMMACLFRRQNRQAKAQGYTKLAVMHSRKTPKDAEEGLSSDSDSDSDSEFEVAEVQASAPAIPVLYDYTGNYQPMMYMPQFEGQMQGQSFAFYPQQQQSPIVQPMNQQPYFYYPMQMPLLDGGKTQDEQHQ